jgi:hypothetical protein
MEGKILFIFFQNKKIGMTAGIAPNHLKIAINNTFIMKTNLGMPFG